MIYNNNKNQIGHDICRMFIKENVQGVGQIVTVFQGLCREQWGVLIVGRIVIIVVVMGQGEMFIIIMLAIIIKI